MGLGTTEIMIIAGVIVLLFGATAIPKFARNIGRAKKEFEKGIKEGGKDADEDDNDSSSSDTTTSSTDTEKKREL